MTDREQYSFIISKEEVLEYYEYVFSHLKNNRWGMLFVRLSVPALLIMSALFYRWQITFVSLLSFLIIIVIWFVYISNTISLRSSKRQAARWLAENNDKLTFEEVNVSFDDKKKICKVNNNPIAYRDIRDVMIWKSLVLVIYDQNKMFILPVRCIENSVSVSEWLQGKKQQIYYNN